MQILQTETIDFLIGYIYASTPVIDPLVIVVAIIAAAISISIGLLLCWDLSKQSIDDIAVVGWVLLFFIVPIISWIAYLLVIRLAK